MKLLLIFGLISIVGCASAVEAPQQQTINNTSTPIPNISGSSDAPSKGGCIQTKLHVVIINGTPQWETDVVSCNEGINLYTGCPSPDKGRPWENNTLLNKENLIKSNN